ncbi:MAG: DNA primase small subunit PriS [Candidatus Bathyarchaeota archaeon]|nr:DNA primase small subunit PriS [Candidatus Bathyarchaeota archaeon]
MAETDRASEQYVAEQFMRYYATNPQNVEAPTEIRQREFGFLSFGGKSMFRHISFDDVQQIRRYLIDYGPAHTYFSAAYYKNPRVDMAYKGWLGADLVFDIDADHFDIPCQRVHDRWSCRTCGEQGTGHPPETCPGCGKATFVEESWLCEECLEAAKYEAQKLLDILIQDFGFSQSGELSVNFSGNRGYHVHVRSPTIKGMGQPARREVVDYMLGIGIEAQYQGFTKRAVGGGSTLAEGGWRGRTVKALYDFVGHASIEVLEGLKLGRKAVQGIQENREQILAQLTKQHPSNFKRYIDGKTLEKLMEAAVKEQASAVDTVVTTDLRRLIRLPNTLHGKTGWLSQAVPIDDLADHDPLSDAVAFTEGTERVHVVRAPEIRIGDESYGPFEDERVELPLAAAMFLLCRKVARVER